ncbi:MAG TPA: succinate dehydrogenase assembly factor 2 [Thiomicrorhabdus sp.]|nr:succinate dehydrogenase assembly factor 2 [Thiomicrorhabdus sp.]
MSLNTSTLSADLTGEIFEIWRKKSLFLAKRGNLESELLLADYINKLPNRISSQNAALFREFLEENDQNLFCWLMTFDPRVTANTAQNIPLSSTPPPDKYSTLVKEIRANYLK